MQERELKITDKHGFIHVVNLQHWPERGYSIAYHRGNRITSRDLSRAGHPPRGDNDREWEEWEEKCAEWIDEVTHCMMPDVQHYINNL